MLGEKKKIQAMRFMSLFTALLIWWSPLYICHFFSELHICLIKKERISSSGYAHLCTCLKFLKHAFLFTSKTYMNLSRRLVFRTPRRPANVLELRTPKWVGFFGIFPKCSLQLFFRNPNGSVIFSTTLMVASGWMERRS